MAHRALVATPPQPYTARSTLPHRQIRWFASSCDATVASLTKNWSDFTAISTIYPTITVITCAGVAPVPSPVERLFFDRLSSSKLQVD